LHKAVLAAFAKLDAAPEAVPHFTTEAAESGHGGKECGHATAVKAMQHLPDEILFLWPKLETLVRMQTQTERAGKVVQEGRFYVSTLRIDKVEALASSVVSHWGIENEWHWVLDYKTHCVEFRGGRPSNPHGQGP
jgi:hypothetical protein